MRQIRDPQIQPAEQLRLQYVATIESGTSINEVLNPGYWAGVADKLRPLTKISCWWEDGCRYVELLVTRTTRTEATVIVLLDKKITLAAHKDVDVTAELKNYNVEFAGPTVGYRVVRLADKAVLHSDVKWNEDQAMRWLLEHLAQPRQSSKTNPPPAAPKAAAA